MLNKRVRSIRDTRLINAVMHFGVRRFDYAIQRKCSDKQASRRRDD